MDFADLVLRNRSYRRFHEEKAIEEGLLRDLVALARVCPSSANRQPLRYIVSADRKKNESIFETLAWAGYLKDWPGPEPGERPAAYIVVLGDREVVKDWSVDPGIVMQTMLLAAVDKGMGGCIFGSIKREELGKRLGIDRDRYEVINVVALGYPKEEVVLDDCPPGGDIKYYRDADGRHHVPKRMLDELILD